MGGFFFGNGEELVACVPSSVGLNVPDDDEANDNVGGGWTAEAADVNGNRGGNVFNSNFLKYNSIFGVIHL